jgi:tight adherence protein C
VIPAPLLAAALLVGVLGMAGGVVMLLQMRRARRLQYRLNSVRGRLREAPSAPEGSFLVRSVAALGLAVARSGMLSAGTISELERSLGASGLHGRNGIGVFIGTKLLLFSVSPVLVLFLAPKFGFSIETTRLMAAIAAVTGLLLPDTIIRRNHQRYLDRVDKGVSDALDMLVICTQAGLGLETAMQRVAVEISHGHPELAHELELTLNEMRISVDTNRAIANLGTRTGLSSLRRITSMLVQTLQYGTPLSDTLRMVSAEIRQEVLIKFEGRAARLPVLLTMPMILFIFPCIFIVMAGPAAMQIGKAFSH